MLYINQHTTAINYMYQHTIYVNTYIYIYIASFDMYSNY